MVLARSYNEVIRDIKRLHSSGVGTVVREASCH